MVEPASMTNMAGWLAAVRLEFVEKAPDLLCLLETYEEEARFGRRHIAGDLRLLEAGAKILEVGAGAMLLSCQLVREGFCVSALEPLGSGFSHFDRMRNIVIDVAKKMNCLPELISVPVEKFDEKSLYDYAFSINVMEHVVDVDSAIKNVFKGLSCGGSYRFCCPNYIFPYEPHFNIPTFFSKKLTWLLMKRRIVMHEKSHESKELWDSLNWINVFQISKCVRGMKNIKAVFKRDTLVYMFERVLSDPAFADRRSASVRQIIRWAVFCKLHRLLKFVPLFLQPTIDVEIIKERC